MELIIGIVIMILAFGLMAVVVKHLIDKAFGDDDE